MKIYITKYALTTGILEAEAEYTPSEKLVFIKENGDSMRTYYSYGDYSFTLAEAIGRAEEMRTAKLLALNKQVSKLSNIDFGKVK